MAKDDERPQFNPKHRIAGAIILVSLAVIFIPMLLDESTPPPENQTLTQIPARDAPAAETKIAVTPITPAAEPSATATPNEPAAVAPATDSPAARTSIEAAKPETNKPDPKPAPADTDEKKQIANASTTQAPDKIDKGWTVQVGTFANAANAERLRERIKSLGYAVNAESIKVDGGKAVRLRVGPYREKAAATKVRAQLQKDLNIQGMIVAYP